MTGHEPSAGAVSDVIAAFAASPVTNPDGTTGIRLHVQDDGIAAVAEKLQTAFEPCTAPADVGDDDFETIKRAQFGTAAERASTNSINILGAKHAAFRYQLWVHDLKNLGSTSGCAELPGNDSVVSLGDWGSPPARVAESGTMMHEFGHTLQLRHGGVDHVNYKPNFISVMSYSFQDNRYVAARSLDYSPFALPSLNESALSETTGLPCVGGCATGDSLAGRTTVFFSPSAVTAPIGPNIDWNQNGTIDPGTVSLSINKDGTTGTLASRNDWATVLYNFRGTLDFAEGVHLTTTVTKEADFTLALDQSADDDHDGVPNVIDNCPTVPNPDQASLFHDGVGTACLAHPTVDCVDHTPKRTFVAHFGYTNSNVQINVPIGPQNQFLPSPADRGQPTKFPSGTVRNAFTVASPGPDVVWSLNGFKAVATHQTPDCGDHP